MHLNHFSRTMAINTIIHIHIEVISESRVPSTVFPQKDTRLHEITRHGYPLALLSSFTGHNTETGLEDRCYMHVGLTLIPKAENTKVYK